MVTENDCFRVLAANYGKHSTDRLGPEAAFGVTTDGWSLFLSKFERITTNDYSYGLLLCCLFDLKILTLG